MTKPYKVQDKYFHLAKDRGYRARSAFKLLDIEAKFHLIHSGNVVLDLGAAPGSFMQVLLNLVGQGGMVLGIDLHRIEPFDESNVIALQGDIFETEALLEILKQIPAMDGRMLDIVTSDLAPKTSGIKDLDQARSVELTDQAFFLATKLLKPGGHFVGKVFEGEDLPLLLKRVKRRFKKVKMFKPPSCRDRSFEKYIVAMGFLG